MTTPNTPSTRAYMDALRMGAADYGSLDQAGDGSMKFPSGATAPDVRPSSESLMIVKDEMVAKAVDALAAEFQTFLTSQQTFITANTEALKTINETLKQIVVQTKNNLGVGGVEGSMKAAGDASSATIGYETTATIAATMGRAVEQVTGSLKPLPGTPGHSLQTRLTAASQNIIGATGGPGPSLPLKPGHPSAPGSPQGGSQTPHGASAGTALPSLASGGSAPGAGLLTKITDHIPGVSQVLGYIHGGYDTFMKQRQADWRYQNMLGGSNTDQINVRAAEQGFTFRHLGESSSVTKPMYEDALSMGYRDRTGSGVGGFFGSMFGGHFGIGASTPGSEVSGQPSASQVAGTAYNLYHNQGVGTAETMNMVNTMAQNGASNLSQVAQSLRDVTDAAREFGVNAVAVRQKLQGTFQATTQAGFRGGAASIADTLTSQITTGGKTLQGVDVSGMVSDQMTYRYAAQSGMTHGQYLAEAANNPGKAANAISRNVDQMINAFVPQSALAYIDQQAEALGGKPVVAKNEALKNQIADACLTKFSGLIDPTVLAGQLSTQTSQNLTADNVWFYVVNWRVGNTIAAQVKANAAKSAVQTVAASTITNQTNKAMGEMKGDFFGFNTKGTEAANRMANVGLMTGGSVGAHTLNDAYGKGKSSPVINALIGAVGNDKQMVRISTHSGDRVMTLAEAIAQFPAEVESGKITMVGGSRDGQTVTEVTGGLADGSRATAREAVKELDSVALAKGQSGQKDNYTADYYDKKHGTGGPKPTPAASATAGGVTVTLSPQAQQLLAMIPNNAAASSGVPMAPGVGVK